MVPVWAAISFLRSPTVSSELERMVSVASLRRSYSDSLALDAD